MYSVILKHSVSGTSCCMLTRLQARLQKNQGFSLSLSIDPIQLYRINQYQFYITWLTQKSPTKLRDVTSKNGINLDGIKIQIRSRVDPVTSLLILRCRSGFHKSRQYLVHMNYQKDPTPWRPVSLEAENILDSTRTRTWTPQSICVTSRYINCTDSCTLYMLP
jgi:hypothetical protein